MKIGLVYSHALGSGGYPRDVRWLATALANHSVHVTLFCQGPAGDPVTEGLSKDVRIESLDSIGNADADVYHVFGILLPGQLWLLRRLLNKPVVVSPMGHLMPFHLKRKAFKKTLYLQVVKPLLKRVRWFHIFSPVEADSVYHYLGSRVNTFEAGLGVFPPPSDVGLTHTDKKPNYDTVNLLFFGRNDVYQKGIDILLQGFAHAVRGGAKATLTIAGQPWQDSERHLHTFIEREQLARRIQVLGPVDEKKKWKLLSEADYLVFLSRWDGPPRPIREAIAVGTPVIVSPETNMGHLISEFNAGIEVKLDPEDVARAILHVEEDRSMRVEHRTGVLRLRERLDWSRVAEDYLQGYEQVVESWK